MNAFLDFPKIVCTASFVFVLAFPATAQVKTESTSGESQTVARPEHIESSQAENSDAVATVSEKSNALVEVRPEDIYSGLVADPIRALVQEILILGLFVVGVGHLRQAIKTPGYFRTSDFVKRNFLLISVVLFVVYMNLTYSVEWALAPSEVLEIAKRTFTETDRNNAAFLVIGLTPIDILITLFLAGMFLVLARDELWEGRTPNLLSTVKFLSLLAAGTHLATILWWWVFGLLTEGSLSRWDDIAYHAIFFAVQMIIFSASHVVGARTRGSDCRAVTETVFVAIFSITMTTVYVTRLWIYVFRYTEP